MLDRTAVTLYGQAYDQIRSEILSGALTPGQPLRLAHLAGRLGMSMSVVREALSRLSAQGLVVASPNQGFRVVRLSEEDLLDLTELRADLESKAFERSIASGDLTWEAQVISAHHVLERTPLPQGSTPEQQEQWVAAHSAFHEALSAGCGSPRLLGMVRLLRDSAEVYRQWSALVGEAHKRDVVAEHRSLMELASARESDRACAALCDHIRATATVVIQSRIMSSANRPADTAGSASRPD